MREDKEHMALGEGFNFDFKTDFDLNFNIGLSNAVDTRYMKARKAKPIPTERIKYSNAKKLAEKIKIEDNVRWDVIVPGNFIFGDLIEAIIMENDAKITEMTVSTLSLDQNNVDSFKNLFVWNRLDKLNLIVSDWYYAHERKGLIPYIIDELDIDNKFQLAIAGIHSKIVLMETLGGKKIVMSGSANLRSSDNIEQFTIEENKELYDFHKEWNKTIIENFCIINKKHKRLENHRGKALWEILNRKQN
jgi:hypothetical protein